MKIVQKTMAATALGLALSFAAASAQEADEPTLKEQLDDALEANRDMDVTLDELDDAAVGSLVLENTTDEPRPLYPNKTPAAPATTTVPEAAPVPASTVTPATPKPAPKVKTVTLSRERISFGFDSAEIKPASDKVLTELATAMSSADFANVVFLIEGHTDGHGPDAYNMQLSERRAQAVKAHLVAAGVPEARLRAVGRGEKQPLNAATPMAAENRRVEIIPADASE